MRIKLIHEDEDLPLVDGDTYVIAKGVSIEVKEVIRTEQRYIGDCNFNYITEMEAELYVDMTSRKDR